MAFRFFFTGSSSQPDLFRQPRLAVWRKPQNSDAATRGLFDGGPPIGLQTAIGLMHPGRRNILLRAVIGVALGWLPLLLLTALQGAMLHDGSFFFFLRDFAVHARSLIVVPLLIWAEAVCLPRLSSIARHLRDKGLVRPESLEAFNHALRSTIKLRDSARLEIAVFTLTAAAILTLDFTLPPGLFPRWYRLGASNAGAMSPAGWWHALVSVPILIILLLGWAWRLVLWTRFLYLVSRLRLTLISAHPDRAGGLRFLGISTQAFSVLAFALGMIVAGTVANRVMHDGVPLLSFRYVLLEFAILCLILFVGPLLVFSGQLLEAWRRGVQDYGTLARGMGLQMESKWLGRAPDADALATGDFSATTDLYSIVANVYAMTVVPVGLVDMAVLVAAAVLPFVPIVLMSVSLEVIIQKLTGISL